MGKEIHMKYKAIILQTSDPQAMISLHDRGGGGGENSHDWIRASGGQF
jgi:hypothetical protein